MLLGDWLEKHKISRKAFAHAIEVGASMISSISSYEIGAGKELSLKIEEATKGEVSRTEAMFPFDYIEKDQNGNIQKRTFAKQPKVLKADARQKLIDAKGTARSHRKDSNQKVEMEDFIAMSNIIKEMRLEIASLKKAT